MTTTRTRPHAIAWNALLALLLAQGPVLASRLATQPEAGRVASSAPAAMPTLAGDAAIERLKAEGDYASLAEAVQASRLRVRPDEAGGFRAANPATHLAARFVSGRVELESTRGEASGRWRAALETVIVGQCGELAAEGARAEGTRMIHEWRTRGGARVTEWHENGAEGLEHGYTVWSAPEGCEARLVVGMRLDGELAAKVADDGQVAVFVDGRGRTRLRYEKLRVWDAAGRALEARIGGGGRELRIEVETTGAVYPVTIDPVFVETVRLTDKNGSNVAISGSTVVVGETYAGDGGAAYILERNAGGANAWHEVAKLTGSTVEAGDEFGSSVAIDGSTVVVAAPFDEGPGDSNGAVFVFERNAGGADAWGQVARLIGSTIGDSQLGYSVAIDGSTVVVGALNTDQSDFGTRVAYVFERNAGGANAWGQSALLSGSSTADQFDDGFGTSVAIDGSTVVVGAPDDNFLGFGTGAAYVFERNAGGADAWRQVARLTGSTADEADQFGRSVAIDGSTVVIGAPSYGGSAGAVYVFERNRGGENVWLETAVLTDSTSPDGVLGFVVAIDGSTVVVGQPAIGITDKPGAALVFERNAGGADAWDEVSHFTGSSTSANSGFGIDLAFDGSTAVIASNFAGAYIFDDICDTWQEVALPSGSTTSSHDELGKSVAVAGSTVLVGAPTDDGEGAAYVFERNLGGADQWQEVARLKGSTTLAGDRFGYSVALSGSTAIVGAILNDGKGEDSGAAYVFERNIMGADTWRQTALLTGSATDTGDWFGASVAIDGSTAVVGSPNGAANGIQSGVAHVFERNAGGADAWQQVKVLAGSTTSEDDLFGEAVAISGSSIVVGAPLNGDLAGAAYVFERNAGGADAWRETALLTGSSTDADDEFGSSVAIDGSTAIVGAPVDERPFGFRGMVYVFERNAGGENVWHESAVLTGSTLSVDAEFGQSVAISGSTVVVGAHYDSGGGTRSGAAYTFERNAGGADAWHETAVLSGSTTSADDWFGESVAIDGATTVVGALYADDSGEDSGAAYIFYRNCPPQIQMQPANVQAGEPAPLNQQVATVSDDLTAVENLQVSVDGVQTSTHDGVTVSNLVISPSGGVTADVVAACTATTTSFTLAFADEVGSIGVAMLWVTVTPDIPPTLAYASRTVELLQGTEATVPPTARPADNLGVTGVAVVGTGGYEGAVSVDAATGIVTFSNAGPPGGLYTIIVRATDTCGNTTDASFPVRVLAPPKIVTAVATVQAGSPIATDQQVATVSDEWTAPQDLLVSVDGHATATRDGVTVSNLRVSSTGAVTASVLATCTATTTTFTLEAEDGDGLRGTAELMVVVTPDTPPTLAYPADTVMLFQGNTGTVVPTPPGLVDNLGINAVEIVGTGGYEGTVSVEAVTGVVTLSKAGPPGGPYTIAVRATDTCGNTTDAFFPVQVVASKLACATDDVTRDQVLFVTGGGYWEYRISGRVAYSGTNSIVVQNDAQQLVLADTTAADNVNALDPSVRVRMRLVINRVTNTVKVTITRAKDGVTLRSLTDHRKPGDPGC